MPYISIESEKATNKWLPDENFGIGGNTLFHKCNNSQVENILNELL